MAKHISYYLPQLRKQLEERGNEPEMPIKSIPSLNRKLWGIQRGKFYVIASRTSNGKSAFVMQIAMDLASQGHPVLFLSLEMDTIAVLERALIQTTKINNTDLLHGKIKQYDKQWDDFTLKSKKYRASTVRFDWKNMGGNRPAYQSIISKTESDHHRSYP